MRTSNNFEIRKFVIGGVAIGIILIYMIRLFTLQLWSDDYKKNADSNAFRKDIQYPSRGLILDRKGRLLVYNEPSYNIMVVMNDQRGVDTLDFCQTIGITKEYYIKRMARPKILATRATPHSCSWPKFPPRNFRSSAKSCSASRVSASRNAQPGSTPAT
jgi:cell division protein FtsI/penicillin-binding protein 2